MTKWSDDSSYILLPPDNEVIEETALAMAQATIQSAMDASLTKRAKLAANMGRPRSFVTRMLSGGHNLTIKTFARALAGCGYELRFSYLPIQASTVATNVGETQLQVTSRAPIAVANEANLGLAA